MIDIERDDSMETLDLSTPTSPYSLSNRDRRPVTYTPPQFEESSSFAQEAPRGKKI